MLGLPSARALQANRGNGVGRVQCQRPEARGSWRVHFSSSQTPRPFGKAFAYVVWGISDRDHSLVGTGFAPSNARVGNEALENWLLRLLEPRLNSCFFQVLMEGHSVIVLENERAFRQPAQFCGQEYIRVGSYKKTLKDNP